LAWNAGERNGFLTPVFEERINRISLENRERLFDRAPWVNFIEMRGFADDWKKLGLTDEDLWAVQGVIGPDPKCHPVISGTGGLRKMRFAPPKKSGRRKWYRLCYVYFQEAAVVLFVVAYSKNEADDIPAADKKYFRQLIAREHAVFSRRAVR
jgi:hypothetical protein